MRKIVVHMMLSLDGYFEGPDHDLSWHLVDEELHAHFNEQLATNSAFMEGRVTYELMEAFWPAADQNLDHPPTMREFAGIWRAVPKIVFSRTLQEVGPNAVLRAEVDPDEIRALKQQPGGDMTLGGVDLVETFRRLDLVDEYRLYVNPVVICRVDGCSRPLTTRPTWSWWRTGGSATVSSCCATPSDGPSRLLPTGVNRVGAGQARYTALVDHGT
jgi:dihydrofolate reductase